MPNYNLQPNKVYDFEFFGTSIIGTGVKSAKVLATASYKMATRYSNIDAIHNALYPDLPVGTSKQASELTYVVVELTNGDTSAYALDWISRSPQEVNSLSFSVTINNSTESFKELLKVFLLQNGVSDFTVSNN